MSEKGIRSWIRITFSGMKNTVSDTVRTEQTLKTEQCCPLSLGDGQETRSIPAFSCFTVVRERKTGI